MSEFHFADRLLAAIANMKTHLIVGLDPVYELYPDDIRGHKTLNDGDDAESAADAMLEFCTRVLKVVAPHVAAVKINSAFFEMYHSSGIEAYDALVQEAAAHGLLVIGDVKRGDIGNTSERYALGNLSDPAFVGMEESVGPDAITVAPYMGSDSVEPFIKVAADEGKGVFVLVRTSNPGSAEIQEQKLADGTPLYMHVAKLVEKWGAASVGKAGYSAVGAVVGATHPEQLAELRAAMPKTLFLVPGLGAQGATARDIARAFKPDGTGAIINSSRGIIFAFKDAKYKGDGGWEKAVERAVIATKKEIAEALGG